MYGYKIETSRVEKFNEEEAKNSQFKFDSGHELIEFFLKKE